ncbi:MAG: hypothetical protein PVG39_25500 [Desulfobacteraceae bacterium]|jgi:hypothetical protein
MTQLSKLLQIKSIKQTNTHEKLLKKKKKKSSSVEIQNDTIKHNLSNQEGNRSIDHSVYEE